MCYFITADHTLTLHFFVGGSFWCGLFFMTIIGQRQKSSSFHFCYQRSLILTLVTINLQIYRTVVLLTQILWRSFESFCVLVFNLRFCHLRLTLGRVPLCMHTHNRDIEKTSGQATQLNIWLIWAMDRTSAQPEPEFVAQKFFEIPLMERGVSLRQNS